MDAAFLSQFVHDDKFTWVSALIVIDIVLGIGAAVYTHKFALHYVANFTRNDVLGKVFPWFVLYAADKASHGANIALGVDMGNIANAVFVGVVAALLGSLATSLGDFGVPLPSPLQRLSSTN